MTVNNPALNAQRAQAEHLHEAMATVLSAVEHDPLDPFNWERLARQAREIERHATLGKMAATNAKEAAARGLSVAEHRRTVRAREVRRVRAKGQA